MCCSINRPHPFQSRRILHRLRRMRRGTGNQQNICLGNFGKIIIGDITYIRMRGGRFCYLAVWQDKITRRIIGWSLGLEMTAELVFSALKKAMNKGLIQAGALVHSDQGSQYASMAFRESLRRNGFQQSMSGKGKGSRQCPTRSVSFRASKQN